MGLEAGRDHQIRSLAAGLGGFLVQDGGGRRERDQEEARLPEDPAGLFRAVQKKEGTAAYRPGLAGRAVEDQGEAAWNQEIRLRDRGFGGGFLVEGSGRVGLDGIVADVFRGGRLAARAVPLRAKEG